MCFFVIETLVRNWESNFELLEALNLSGPGMRQGNRQPKSHSCTRCNKQYSCSRSLRRHEFLCTNIIQTYLEASTASTQYIDENRGERKFVCTYCGRSYRWKKGLKAHQLRCEPKLEHDRQDGNLEKDPLSLNPNVKEKTKGNSKKISHDIPAIVINNVTSGRFQCILCGRRYSWLKNLRRHQNLCRKNLVKQRWKECKVMLEPLSAEYAINIPNPNFKCDNCGREYRWLKGLRHHQNNCTLRQNQNEWDVTENAARPPAHVKNENNEENCNLDDYN